jgi:membrane protease YdiL (CAAX protease family)
MTDAHTTSSGVASPANSLVAVAATASTLWVVVEFAVRRGLTAPIGAVLESSALGYVTTLALTAIVLAPTIALFGTRAGISPGDWELPFSVRGALEAVGATLAYYVFVVVAAVVLVAVFGAEQSSAQSGIGFADASTLAVVGFVVANGVFVPIAEEIAWRGVVQTALTNALGVAAGIAITAVAFVAKHVVVDLGATPIRLASLLFLAFAFGILRHRHGTGSATVAHVLANTTATLSLVLA